MGYYLLVVCTIQPIFRRHLTSVSNILKQALTISW